MTDSLALNLMNIVEFSSQFISMFLIKRFRRRTIFLTYGVLLATLNSLLALVDIAGWNVLALFVFLLMVFSFECFGQPVMQLYAVEITTNAATGVLQVFQNVFMFVAGVGIRYMVVGTSVPLLFFISSAITGALTVFMYFILRETSTLTDKEKKCVYALGPKKSN